MAGFANCFRWSLSRYEGEVFVGSSAAHQVPGNAVMYSGNGTTSGAVVAMASPPNDKYGNSLLFSKSHLFSAQAKYAR